MRMERETTQLAFVFVSGLIVLIVMFTVLRMPVLQMPFI